MFKHVTEENLKRQQQKKRTPPPLKGDYGFRFGEQISLPEHEMIVYLVTLSALGEKKCASI